MGVEKTLAGDKKVSHDLSSLVFSRQDVGAARSGRRLPTNYVESLMRRRWGCQNWRYPPRAFDNDSKMLNAPRMKKGRLVKGI